MGKAFEKQTNKIEDQRKKQVDALKSLESSDKQLSSIKDFISRERLNPKIMNEIERIEEEKKAEKGYNKIYDFRKLKTIRVFGDIRNNFISMGIANDEQKHLAKYTKEFKSKTRPQDSNLKRVKENV